MRVIEFIITGSIWFLACSLYAQEHQGGTVKLPYQDIYALGLDANVRPILSLLDVDVRRLSDQDKTFKTNFELRFGGADDGSAYDEAKESEISDLLSIFRSYWRTALLDTSRSYDPELAMRIVPFLKQNYLPVRDIDIARDSIGFYTSQYVRSKGLFTTGTVGKTGRLYDLLVWRAQKDTTYTFSIHGETLETRVVFMQDFITLGWEEYATLGKYYPGGWTTTEALYCVASAYDLNSEAFNVRYLAHEGRHYADYKLFPKLTSADLEYRAKLTELSLAKSSIPSLIQFFINNANYDSDNGHSVANYCVIRDLSKALFNVDFERSKAKWTSVSTRKINKTALKLLTENTETLRSLSPDIEAFIKLRK
jgi:hypothetical protein